MRLATAIVILSLVTPAMAQETRPTLMMGIGRLSCATWLADPYSENEGSAWLLGYWSATLHTATKIPESYPRTTRSPST